MKFELVHVSTFWTAPLSPYLVACNPLTMMMTNVSQEAIEKTSHRNILAPGFRHVADPRHFEGSAPLFHRCARSPPPPREAELRALLDQCSSASASHSSLDSQLARAPSHLLRCRLLDRISKRLRNGEHTRLRLGHGPARCGVAGPGLARRERGREQLERARRGRSAARGFRHRHLAVARCHLRHVCNITSVWWSEVFPGFVPVVFRHYLESCFRKCVGPFLWPALLSWSQNAARMS